MAQQMLNVCNGSTSIQQTGGKRLSQIVWRNICNAGSLAWINSIFLVMNLPILLRILFALCKTGVAIPTLAFMWIKEMPFHP